MNVLDEADRNRILDLLSKGWSIRQVARDTGHRHETIRRYGVEAGILTPKPAKCTTPAEVATDSKPHTELEVPTGRGVDAQQRRAVSAVHRGRAAQRPQRQGDLPRPRPAPRLRLAWARKSGANDNRGFVGGSFSNIF